MSYSRMTKGFTLVELMIVVVIIGILASVAYPAYIDNTRAAKRTAAQADLMKLSAYLERNFTESNSYFITDPGTAVVCGAVAACNASLALLGVVEHDDYTFSFATVTATSFSLQAIAQGSQGYDECGTMTLAETGATTAGGTNCWR